MQACSRATCAMMPNLGRSCERVTVRSRSPRLLATRAPESTSPIQYRRLFLCANVSANVQSVHYTCVGDPCSLRARSRVRPQGIVAHTVSPTLQTFQNWPLCHKEGRRIAHLQDAVVWNNRCQCIVGPRVCECRHARTSIAVLIS
jgi:hypothetical protein